MRDIFITGVLLITGCVGNSNDTDNDTSDTSDTSKTGDTSDTGDTELNALDADFESNLGDAQGCGDYFVYTANTEDTNALFVSGVALAQQAHDAGEVITMTYTLPNDALSILARTGSDLTEEACNDAPTVDATIDWVYTASSGTATVTMTPTGEPTAHGGYPANVEIIFENVELIEDTGVQTTVIIETLILTAGIGWLPG